MVKWKNGVGLTAPDTLGFMMENDNYGALHAAHGINFGASWAECILGPDIAAPGGTVPNNQPTATGEGWDMAWVNPPPRPGHVFTQDQRAWRRGHFINAEWGGSGSTWLNLTPLTSQANSWHTGVENSMRAFLNAARNYDLSAPYKNNWIGIRYKVVRSVLPYADPANPLNLYSYAPSHIGVSWRAVSLPKINHNSLAHIINNAVANAAPLAALPVNFPAFTAYAAPGPLVGHQTAGASPLVAPLAAWAANGNGFDGEIEVHNV